MISPIFVVPKGTIYCPKYSKETNMQDCANCPFFGGMKIISGYGAASCFAIECLYKSQG